jgi:hypothetical protein
MPPTLASVPPARRGAPESLPGSVHLLNESRTSGPDADGRQGHTTRATTGVVLKQTLKIGVTVLVVAALAMSGIALAQSDEEAPADDGADRAAAAIVERLAPLIEDGTITEAQAEAVAGTLADGFGRPRPPRALFKGLDAAADFLGMEIEDLAAQMRDGETLAAIAGDQADELIAALVADAEEHLAAAVEDGKLAQDEADERLAELEERITTFVNEGPPERPIRRPGGFDGRHGHGGPGPDGGDAGQDA